MASAHPSPHRHEHHAKASLVSLHRGDDKHNDVSALIEENAQLRELVISAIQTRPQKCCGSEVRPPQLAASFISNEARNVAYWHLADNPVAPAFVRFLAIADNS